MQSSEQVNNIAPNYCPEVETEKPITRKRKERVVRKFAHAQIAILASSYSDDVITTEVKK